MALVNVFASYEEEAWPYRFRGTLRYRDIVVGGTPSDPKVAQAWLKTKVADNDDILRQMVAEIMTDRKVAMKEALAEAVELRLLKGFKRDATGHLVLDARCLKACFKESACIADAAGAFGEKFGKNRAGVRSFVAEHIMVVGNQLRLLRGGKPIKAYDGIQQRFVHTFRGAGITYEEFVNEAEIEFTMISDWQFGDRFWGVVWNKAAEQGLGATRSQGFGKFVMTRWDPVHRVVRQRRAPAAKKAAQV